MQGRVRAASKPSVRHCIDMALCFWHGLVGFPCFCDHSERHTRLNTCTDACMHACMHTYIHTHIYRQTCRHALVLVHGSYMKAWTPVAMSSDLLSLHPSVSICVYVLSIYLNVCVCVQESVARTIPLTHCSWFPGTLGTQGWLGGLAWRSIGVYIMKSFCVLVSSVCMLKSGLGP